MNTISSKYLVIHCYDRHWQAVDVGGGREGGREEAGERDQFLTTAHEELLEFLSTGGYGGKRYEEVQKQMRQVNMSKSIN